MITTLKIKNFAIIENIELSFTDGLNVLTGETGAGKSILINAIKLILGARASADIVRHEAVEAELQAIFDITDHGKLIQLLVASGIAIEDKQVIIRRIITNKGQSKVFINDKSSTLSLLNQITPLLIDICSQNENRSLFLPENQINLLDAYCGNQSKVLEFKSIYNQINLTKSKLKELNQIDQEKEQKLDYYKFQLDEITLINPKKDEDTNLEEELNRIDSSKTLVELAQQAHLVFYDDESVISRLESLKEKVDKAYLKNCDDFLIKKIEKIDQLLESAELLGKEFSNYKKSITYEPKRRENILERVQNLKRIKRKFGGSLETVFEKINFLKSELSKMEHSDELKKQLNLDLKKLMVKAEDLGKELHNLRVESAKIISDKITHQMQDLNMKGAKLEIRVEFNKDKMNNLGFDEVLFSFAPNKGEPFNSLSKIASGGELSRVTLAIHNVLTKEDSEKIYVFDEVDAGIGGDTGKLVGRKLKEISKSHQVICITHLPQVAVFGVNHILLYKNENNGRVTTKADSINEPEKRVREIARMLNGDSKKKEALDHALVLLKEAKK